MTTECKNPFEQGKPIDFGLCSLPDWGLIFVEGPDTASFLQNQLTNSVLGLNKTISPEIARSPSSVRLVGYCSPKGRLLASAWLALFPRDSSSENRFVLFISKDIAASIAKRLSMYVLRSKVKVIDASNDWNVLAYCSANKQTNSLTLDGSQIGLQLPDVKLHDHVYGRVLIAQPHSSDAISNQKTVFQTWSNLEVLSAIPRIVRATQEQFVPQMTLEFGSCVEGSA
jgi:folate-binding Fe-S cluster repair protein YgfZ